MQFYQLRVLAVHIQLPIIGVIPPLILYLSMFDLHFSKNCTESILVSNKDILCTGQIKYIPSFCANVRTLDPIMHKATNNNMALQ